MESKWSLGVLIGLPAWGVVFLIVLVFIAVAILVQAKERDAWGMILGGVATFVALLAIFLSPLGYYPYEAQYHRWEPVTGTVTDVSKRIVGGDQISEKFVVRFAGSRQEYGCEDSRCAVIKPGDKIGLSCIRVWQYSGIDGYDCRFGYNDGAEDGAA